MFRPTQRFSQHPNFRDPDSIHLHNGVLYVVKNFETVLTCNFNIEEILIIDVWKL